MFKDQLNHAPTHLFLFTDSIPQSLFHFKVIDRLPIAITNCDKCMMRPPLLAISRNGRTTRHPQQGFATAIEPLRPPIRTTRHCPGRRVRNRRSGWFAQQIGERTQGVAIDRLKDRPRRPSNTVQPPEGKAAGTRKRKHEPRRSRMNRGDKRRYISRDHGRRSIYAGAFDA